MNSTYFASLLLFSMNIADEKQSSHTSPEASDVSQEPGSRRNRKSRQGRDRVYEGYNPDDQATNTHHSAERACAPEEADENGYDAGNGRRDHRSEGGSDWESEGGDGDTSE